MNYRILLIALLVLIGSGSVAAAPFLPKDDAQVLETLRNQPSDPSIREARKLRAELARDPTNVGKAVETARRYIEQARASADPRFFGYAQAALGPWWNSPDAPSDVLFLRATLLQASHNFKGAMTDLERLLQDDPGNLEAYLLRAIMLQVVGRYEEAKEDCRPLLQAAQRRSSLKLVATTCVSSVASFNGQAEASYDALRRALTASRGDSTEDTQWALTTLGDMASRLGRAGEAEDYFKQAIALGRDAWLLNTYADFLLDQGRPKEVIDLLKNETNADTMLLLLTLAEKQVNAPDLQKHIQILRQRYAAMSSRNDMRHLREEARFTLHLLNQPRAALRLAQADWLIQQEPEDARIVLESALAAQDWAAAKPVLDFLKEKHLEDVRLEKLEKQFEGKVEVKPVEVKPVKPKPAEAKTS